MIHWTIAGRAPATTSGTFVFTCATTAREPIVEASEAARTVTRRSNIVRSAIWRLPPQCGRSVHDAETKMKRRSARLRRARRRQADLQVSSFKFQVSIIENLAGFGGSESSLVT